MHRPADQAMLAGVNERPIAADLFKTAPELRLVGGRNRASGRIVFPMPSDRDTFEPIELPHHGLLWSYTVQRFEPKSPPYLAAQPFEPFAVGYVELPGTLIIESRLIDVRFDELRIGMPMELATFALRTDERGAVSMFAFRPQQEARR
jgi:uncharacterized OB-fold protein